MKTLIPSSQFKKDYKRIRNNPRKVASFEAVATMLIKDIPIPAKYRPHRLKGEWANYMECHIENDLLLIWLNEEEDTISLIRLGSHSELFG